MAQKLSTEEIGRLVMNAYDRIALMYNDAYAENDLLDYEHLRPFIELVQSGKVLDMGCGCGESTSFLSQNGIDVIGVDFSENMLKEAEQLYPDLTFYKQDILSTSFKDASFDGIVLTYVINHFDNQGLQKLKAEIDRLLKKNGLVFLSVHVGNTEEFVPDPLNENVKIYYNFLNAKDLDTLFCDYTRIYYKSRPSYGEEEFLCDKMFIMYKRNNTKKHTHNPHKEA